MYSILNKEGLTVDELDKAIYEYYETLKTSLRSMYSSNDKGYNYIAKQIGKSAPRVRKAIDRYEFKRDVTQH